MLYCVIYVLYCVMYDKVHGYYSMYYKSKKYWEYPKVERICIVNKHKIVYKSNKDPKYNIPSTKRKGII